MKWQKGKKMTTNNITARTYNSIAKDHEEKKLLVSASFLKKAGKYGTKEAKALEKEMKKYPSYKIEVKVAEKEKNSYKGLTIEKMANWLYDNGRKEELTTLKGILDTAKNLGRSAYPIAKKWFIENYGEEFGAKREERFDLDSFISKVAA